MIIASIADLDSFRGGMCLPDTSPILLRIGDKLCRIHIREATAIKTGKHYVIDAHPDDEPPENTKRVDVLLIE